MISDRTWNILLVEDDEDDYILTRDLLSESRGTRFELTWESHYDIALKIMRSGKMDAILVDYRLGARSGLELTRQAITEGVKAPVILLTGQGSYEVDLEAMKAGATDYLVKGEVSGPMMERTIRYAVERKQAEEALRRAHDELELRVEERTRELAQANQDLLNEIQERLRAERAVRESEHRFRKLAETTSTAILIVQGTHILYANTAARVITGYPPNELINMEFWEIAHPSYQDMIKQRGVAGQWSGKLAEVIPARYELKLLTKRGEERWADVTAGSMEYNGQPAWVVTVFDITERDQAEQALRAAKEELEMRVEQRTSELQEINRLLEIELAERVRSAQERERLLDENRRQKELFQLLFDTEPDGIAVLTGPELHYQMANPAYRALTPTQTADLTGKSYADIWANDCADKPRATLLCVMEDGKAVNNERFDCKFPDGSRRYFSFHARRFPWVGEYALLLVLWETTRAVEAIREREQLMVQLESEQARLKAIIESAPEAIVFTDEEGSILLANPAAEQLYARPIPYGQDYSTQAVFDQRKLDETPYDPRQLPLIRSALDGETISNHELLIHWPDGRFRNLLWSTAPILDRQRQITGAVAVFQDITQRKQAEEEIHRNNARIEVQRHLMQNREMERLQIARDLHDGPLQGLIGVIYALKDITRTPEEGEPPLSGDGLQEKMDSLTRMLQAQVQDMRSFCYELRPPTLIPLGLEKAILSHAEAWHRINSRVQVHLDLARDGLYLPEQVRLALFRIYQESLSNIVRHSSASELNIHFHLHDDRVELKIEDNGTGFVVADSWVEMARSGHLGLVGMQERAESVGGALSVSSNPGSGTTVKVTIPWEAIKTSPHWGEQTST